jgi:hypothetical protein
MRLIHFTEFLFLSLLLASAAFAGQETVGIIKSVSGEAKMVSNNTVQPAAVNLRVPNGALLKTGAGGCVGVIFNDDTLLSLGADSEIAIDEVLFSPGESRLSFAARLLKGTFAFVTGQIARLAPGKVQLSTPEATLGVRGTFFVVAVK